MPDDLPFKVAQTPVLDIAYIETGPSDGWPVILSHGFPYDVHAFDGATAILVREGARVIRPYARGFGPTRFRSDEAMRNGQQAARGGDVLALSDALGLNAPILGGFDWGGNASCVCAALWPDRVAGLVSYAGYDIIDLAGQREPADPTLERVAWYQHLFQTERGRSGLIQHRRDIARMLWREWSPEWDFTDAVFDQTAASFDNPDFVDVVIHCYQWMFGREQGDAALSPLEATLSGKPGIKVPAVTLDGTLDPLKPGGSSNHAPLFAGQHEHWTVRTGHNMPQEAPEVFADAVLRVRDWSA